MKKLNIVVAAAGFLLVCCSPLHAQGGCIDSPENPTAILALVGTMGGFGAYVRNRIRDKKKAPTEQASAARNGTCQ